MNQIQNLCQVQWKFCLHSTRGTSGNILSWSRVRLRDSCSACGCWADRASVAEPCPWGKVCSEEGKFVLFCFLILTERTDKLATSQQEAMILLFLRDWKPIWTAYNYNHFSSIIICQWNESLQFFIHVPTTTYCLHALV